MRVTLPPKTVVLRTFAPRAKEKARTMPHELVEIDMLIGTECISEGQNLQDCDTVINDDIHWNPVRIIQRFGRVDRIAPPTRASSWSTTGPISAWTSPSA